MIDMLARQPDPLLDLAGAPALLDLALETERRRVARVEPQHFLDLLERERIFLFFEPRAGALHQLRNRALPRHLIDLRPQHRQLRVDGAFGLELADDLAGKLVIAAFERLR